MGEWIEVEAADGHVLSAYQVKRSDKSPWLVVVQEAFGVNQHIQNVCQRYSDQGFNVIAPALFDRVERGVEMDYTAESVERYRGFRAEMTTEGVIADIEAARKAAGSSQPGIVGFCFGGSAAWWIATNTTDFACASCWYGGEIVNTATIAPQIPVQMHFGGADPHIKIEDVKTIEAARPDVELYIYEGADHGFGCDARPSFNQKAYDLAFERTIAFFKKHVPSA